MGNVGQARDFLASHCGLPRWKVAHYVAVIEDPSGDLAGISTCCDGVDDAQRMLSGALTVLTLNVPLVPFSDAVIVKRDDVRAVLKAELPDEVRARLRAQNTSQAALAAYLGITEKHMSQVLTGKAGGSPQMIDAIAEAVGLRIALVASEGEIAALIRETEEKRAA